MLDDSINLFGDCKYAKIYNYEIAVFTDEKFIKKMEKSKYIANSSMNYFKQELICKIKEQIEDYGLVFYKSMFPIDEYNNKVQVLIYKKMIHRNIDENIVQLTIANFTKKLKEETVKNVDLFLYGFENKIEYFDSDDADKEEFGVKCPVQWKGTNEHGKGGWSNLFTTYSSDPTFHFAILNGYHYLSAY